jgi:hypothetical protein
MFLSKKRYVRVHEKDYGWDRKKESNARYTTKNIIAAGATVSLAYLSYKYGLDSTLQLTHHTFNFDETVSAPTRDAVENLFAVSGGSIVGGALLGLFAELGASISSRYDFDGTVFKRVLLATPIAVTAFYLHNHGIDVAMEGAKHLLYGGASLATATLSIAGIMSPLFFSSIANYIDEKLDTGDFSAFKNLTHKFTDYFTKLKKERKHQKNLNVLEKSEEKIQQNDSQIGLKKIVSSQFETLNSTIHEAISRYHVQVSSFELKNYLDKLLNHSLFILDNEKDTTAFTAKSEVISLVNSTLPQLVLSYYRSLNNQDAESIKQNTVKLIGALKATNEHFEGIVEEIKENQAQANNMDFEQAIAFTHSRFAKKEKIELEQNHKNLKMGA